MKRALACSAFLLLSSAGPGSPECPCISQSSGSYNLTRSQLLAAGFPADYGTAGCQAYDSIMASSGCAASERGFCQNAWCYVDMAFCPIDQSRCEKAGGLEGSGVSPFCRSRTAHPSTLHGLPGVFYSYETCGFMNQYDTNLTQVVKRVAGHVIRVAADDSFPPWVVKRSMLGGQKEWSGPSYDFFVEALDAFHPRPIVSIVPGWATAGSRKIFANSYTACVHDVAVGNFDMCVGDFWITPERNQLVTFLPAVRQDFLYLVVPAKLEGVTIWTRLNRPFLPFTPDGWLGVAAFLSGMSVLLWLVRLCESRPEGACAERCTWRLAELGQFHFNVWHDFLLGESSHEAEKGPAHKFFSLAFAFFILVTIASYTASLASMLVVEKHTVGDISSLDDAVLKGVPICVPTVVFKTFRNVFPQATFVEVAGYSPRVILSGTCGAIVLSQALIENMHGGMFVKEDCEAVKSGILTEAEAHCDRENDCQFQRVGDVLWSTPLSFPVSESLAHSLSWAFTLALSEGVFEQKKRANKDVFPACRCEEGIGQSKADRKNEGLSLADLSGTIFISCFLMLLGLVSLAGVRLWEKFSPRPEEHSNCKPLEHTPPGEKVTRAELHNARIDSIL